MKKKKFVTPALSIWLFTSESIKKGGVRKKKGKKDKKKSNKAHENIWTESGKKRL